MTNDIWHIYTANESKTSVSTYERPQLLISVDKIQHAIKIIRDISDGTLNIEHIGPLVWAERDGIPRNQMTLADYIPIHTVLEWLINPNIYTYTNQPLPAKEIQYLYSAPKKNNPYIQEIYALHSFYFSIDPLIRVNRHSIYNQNISAHGLHAHLVAHTKWSIDIFAPNITTSPADQRVNIHQPTFNQITINPKDIACPTPTMRDILTYTIMEHPELSYSQHERIRLLRQLCDHPNIDLDTTIPDQWSHNTPS